MLKFKLQLLAAVEEAVEKLFRDMPRGERCVNFVFVIVIFKYLAYADMSYHLIKVRNVDIHYYMFRFF